MERGNDRRRRLFIANHIVGVMKQDEAFVKSADSRQLRQFAGLNLTTHTFRHGFAQSKYLHEDYTRGGV